MAGKCQESTFPFLPVIAIKWNMFKYTDMYNTIIRSWANLVDTQPEKQGGS